MSQNLAEDLASAVRSVARDWKKAKRRADRKDRVSRRDLERMKVRSYRETVRDVAFRVMEEAYLKASGDGRYPANARQIYYAARPSILAEAKVESVDSQYFTQTILKEYMESKQPDWDVVYDARGHLAEPHTGEVVELGGIQVRDYIEKFGHDFDEAPRLSPAVLVPVKGPVLRYGAVLFIEKEGFGPLVKAARIAERFDVAITSTKGLPVSALCDLLAELARHGRTAYVVHDFDKSGFSIVGTLARGTRGSHGTGTIVDIGFRLADIKDLQKEEVTYQQKENPQRNLRENGATDAEIAVLVQSGFGGWKGQRVELNAMTTDQFVSWLERKLKAHGVGKLIPNDNILASAYRRAAFLRALQEQTEKLRNEITADDEIPAHLGKRVRDMLRRGPTLSWDEAIGKIAGGDGAV